METATYLRNRHARVVQKLQDRCAAYTQDAYNEAVRAAETARRVYDTKAKGFSDVLSAGIQRLDAQLVVDLARAQQAHIDCVVGQNLINPPDVAN